MIVRCELWNKCNAVCEHKSAHEPHEYGIWDCRSPNSCKLGIICRCEELQPPFPITKEESK